MHTSDETYNPVVLGKTPPNYKLMTFHFSFLCLPTLVLCVTHYSKMFLWPLAVVLIIHIVNVGIWICSCCCFCWLVCPLGQEDFPFWQNIFRKLISSFFLILLVRGSWYKYLNIGLWVYLELGAKVFNQQLKVSLDLNWKNQSTKSRRYSKHPAWPLFQCLSCRHADKWKWPFVLWKSHFCPLCWFNHSLLTKANFTGSTVVRLKESCFPMPTPVTVLILLSIVCSMPAKEWWFCLYNWWMTAWLVPFIYLETNDTSKL